MIFMINTIRKFLSKKITFARHKFGQLEAPRTKTRSLVQKPQPLEKCQFENYSNPIASHCMVQCDAIRREQPEIDTFQDAATSEVMNQSQL